MITAVYRLGLAQNKGILQVMADLNHIQEPRSHKKLKKYLKKCDSRPKK
jgi:hypothetical protein